jgi:hypothetical protein
LELQKEFGWKHSDSFYTSTSAWNMNEVEKRVHQLLFDDPMSIWLVCGAGGVTLCKHGNVLEFTLSCIYGPTEGLVFRAVHPRVQPL